MGKGVLGFPLLALAVICAAAAPPRAQDDAVLEKAMAAELRRAASELKQEGYPAPYFVSLTATDVEVWERRCSMGSPTFAASYRQRLVTPDLRVGGHDLDNTPLAPSEAFAGRSVGFEDDEFALRHALWLQLDGAYKSAAADFLRKKAARVRRGKAEYDTDDLSREAPRRRKAQRPEPAFDPQDLAELCRRASAAFRSLPALLEAEAVVRSRRQWSRLMDSQDSRVDFGSEIAEIELEAVALSTDGLKLYASRRFLSPSPRGLPTAQAAEGAAREMVEDLKLLQGAQAASPFGAPALLDPSVAAAVVLSIGTRLSGEEQRNPSGAQTFRGKIGMKVLPEEFSLIDDPTLGDFGGVPLAGAYEFDDQGMPARKVALVEKGILKGFLLSRYPVIGFPRSNGHGRAYPGYLAEGYPATLKFSSARGLGQEELLLRLRQECRRRGKPYGLWVRRLRSFSQNQGASGHGSIRLMPGLVYLVEARTGALSLVRDLDMVGTPLVLMNNILSAGDDAAAHNLAAGVPVSVISPSLLLAEAELQRAETRPEKAPLLAPPPGGPGR